MVNEIFQEIDKKCEDSIDHLHQEYARLQTGRASTALVEHIMVDSYGTKTPLVGMASLSTPESTQIAIQPWNRDQMPNIEKALIEANLGMTPQNDGVIIRLNIPPLTEERRKDLVKLVHQYAEDSRISVRNARHEANNALKDLEKAKEISEDELRGKEKEIQDKVDGYNHKIEEAAKHKEKDIMTV